MAGTTAGNGISILGPPCPGFEEILRGEALAFVADLVRTFRPRVEELRRRRLERRAGWDRGERPGFLEATREIREGDWTCAPVPPELADRRVEITGPPERKMVINALNSGANVFMADFEDANAPTWANVVAGQLNLADAVRGTITWDDPATGRHYALRDDPAVLFVRPRGWHLDEAHLDVDGAPVPGGLFDFGLFAWHNAAELVSRGARPCFYLPKLEGHLEARLWNDVLSAAEDALGLTRGTMRATVLIETLPAAFEMDEILWELREHSLGLNCGRWDYIFSFIKVHREDPAAVLPDRDQVTMEQPFMRAYTQLVIRTCHRRGVHAMGGMAAQIPLRSDPERTAAALEKVRADKLREVRDGHDGTWVAHPGLVPVAREVFDAHMPGPNQIHRKREDVRCSAADLLAVPTGTRTLEGLRHNIRVGVQYLEAWLGGQGCVPLYGLMEDAATAEISRAQVWQWLRHRASLESGEVVTPELIRQVLAEELGRVRGEVGAERYDGGRFDLASRLFDELSTAERFPDFLTLPAYRHLVTRVDR
ncbi:MAG: malate synthase A [Acidobacteria bacterium]|nr:MAG: malate synthase A [Acidobacteriota bacterium]